MEGDVSGPLFERVSFTVIPSDDLSPDQVKTVVDVVVEQGGEYVPLTETGAIDRLHDLTHIISTHVEFPEYLQVLDCRISVVKPSWVEVSVVKRRQATPRQYSPDPSQFFHDVVLTCGTLPIADQDAIMAGVIALGGQCSGPLTKVVTHIVSTDMDNEKCKIVQEKGLHLKIVLPNWFDDCLKLGRKISERPYELPDPELLKLDNHNPVRVDPSPFVNGASTTEPEQPPYLSPPSSPTELRKQLKVFVGKKLFIGKDLALSAHLSSALETIISHGGGTMSQSVNDADIYIGRYRDTPDFIAAFRAERIIANLSWLYHVINQNRWLSPLNRLLHYPVPRQGIPGFENMRISVSNYSGDARIYIQNLIKECGAEFTRTMRQDNTHLITAHKASEKCEAAQEWNINVINHLWIEESYAKCAVQSLSNPRYTHFPARTNLGEVCCQTAIDLHRIERVYIPKIASPPKPTKPSPRKTVPASSAAHNDGPFQARTDFHIDIPEQVDEDGEMEEDSTSEAVVTRDLVTQQISDPQLRSEGKENLSPRHSGRASKVKAADALKSQADDMLLFQRELKRKGGVTHGHFRSSTGPASSPAAAAALRGTKRVSEEMSYEATAEGSDLSDGETQRQDKRAKRVKSAEPPTMSPSVVSPIQYHMMVSGDQRWTNNTAQESKDKIKLRQLGVLLTDDPRKVDILVAPRIRKTRKFVAAIANAPLIVDSTYLDAALKHNKLVAQPPLLKDTASEKEFGFKLSDALKRAKINRGRLLSGWQIFVTNDVSGGFETYQEIIGMNGGVTTLFTNRRGLKLEQLRADNPRSSGEDHGSGEGDSAQSDIVYLVASDSIGDKRLWKPFRDLVESRNLVARVVKKDWLLNSVLSQQIRWDPEWQWPK